MNLFKKNERGITVLAMAPLFELERKNGKKLPFTLKLLRASSDYFL
jgi:hypothetical protein